MPERQMRKRIGIIDITDSLRYLSWNYMRGRRNRLTYQPILVITCDESVEKIRAVQMIDKVGGVG